MDISELISNLDDYDEIKSNKETDSIIEELSKFSMEDFIYLEYVGNNEYLKIRDLFESLTHEIYLELKKDDLEKKVAIVKSLIKVFQKGVGEIDSCSFLIFLHANCQVNLSIDDLLLNLDLKNEFSRVIIELSKIVENIKLDVVDTALSLYFDKLNALNKEKSLLKVLNQIDFDKYSPLIKNNPFILPNHFYGMIDALHKYGFGLLENILLSTDNIFTLIFIIKCMSLTEIDSFFIHKDIGEKTLVSFLMKFLMEDNKNKTDYSNSIVDMCIRLYNLNKNLFNEFMDIFWYDEFFNEILGLMLCDLPKKDIKFLINNFPFSNNMNMIKVRTKMLDNCSGCENIEYILELIHEKWKFYIFDSFNEKERLFNILITDFCNFITLFYFNKYDNEKLLISMKELFIKLKNLDNEWSYNLIQHRNKFFVYYSKLFIFSVIYKEFNMLVNDEIKEFYSYFYYEFVVYKKFLDDNNENFLKQFEENLS